MLARKHGISLEQESSISIRKFGLFSGEFGPTSYAVQQELSENHRRKIQKFSIEISLPVSAIFLHFSTGFCNIRSPKSLA